MVRIKECPDVEIFDGSETHGNSAYMDCVKAHPDGFVAQGYKPFGADVTTIHRANCPEVSTSHEQNYTEGMYFMAFSQSLETLKNCAEGWEGKVVVCEKCKPQT